MNKSVFHGKFRITGIYHQITGAWTSKNPHTGLDMVGDENSTVYSPCSGTVEYTEINSTGFGNYIRIRNIDKKRHYLCHLKSFVVIEGQKVNYGDVIGVMGATGNVTGIHTHYEIRDDNGNTYNPADYLGLPNIQGTYSDFNVSSVQPLLDKYDINNYGVGKVNDCILWLGQALIKKGYTKHFTFNNYRATTSWGEMDRLNLQDFQRAQGWTGSDADGYAGKETLKRLYS